MYSEKLKNTYETSPIEGLEACGAACFACLLSCSASTPREALYLFFCRLGRSCVQDI